MTEECLLGRRTYWTTGSRIIVQPRENENRELGDVLFRGDTGVTIRLDNGGVRFYPWSAILYVEALE